MQKRSFDRIRRVSVIIPTLNEERNIGDCIASVAGQPAVSQVIVADGGSTDHTLREAAKLGATVISCERGRGIQIAEAAKQVEGDAILILHADSRLLPGTARRVMHFLNRHPYAAGGAMLMAFERTGWKKKTIAFLNNLRTRLTGIAFGDQAQFFRTEALPLMGGFPSLPLMEDVELSLRLKRAGEILFLPRGTVVSARRWEQGPFLGNVATVLLLFSRYLIKRRLGGGKEDQTDYYRKYYGKDSGTI
ncbi:MAG: TIGR04283 family arsenosugar biosynthesis glycosyltransferase [Deltaproteobacteria bacterium]|nr:TIGR04283 family arsenosugar biosynthesis glycosyltransferase [Deltaproteobacteria bacterium]